MDDSLDLKALDNKLVYGNEFKFAPLSGTCIYNKLYHSPYLRDVIKITIQKSTAIKFGTNYWTLRCNIPELVDVSKIPINIREFNGVDTRSKIVLNIIRHFCNEIGISIRSVISNYPNFNAVIEKGIIERGRYISILESHIKIISRDEKISEVIDESN